MQWSPKQDAALKAIARWFKDPHSPQVFRLFGYAGTGKTTLAKQIAEDVGGMLFAAYTGKASLVLRSKGCTGASTLHSLCYKPQEDEDTGEVTFVLNPDSPLATQRLLCVDEVSMVGPELGRDVLSFGTKVLVLGDPFQLPPVNGDGFFTDQEPDLLLDEIHRQAAENPIIRMSMDLREGKPLQYGQWGGSRVITRASLDKDAMREAVLSADQMLVGMNKTRNTFNARIRQLKGFNSEIPMPGERLVCLKNNKTKGLLNGGLWECVEGARKPNAPGRLVLKAKSLDDPSITAPVDIDTHLEFFGGNPKDNIDWRVRKYLDEFDYGNALTVHKSQGSQWPNVILFDESGVFRENAARHAYTGVTRAAENITVVRD